MNRKDKATIALCLLLLLCLAGCSATSKHWKEPRKVKHPLTGEEIVVEQDIIEQTGIIKAKHPTGADAESKPWFKLPDVTPIK